MTKHFTLLLAALLLSAAAIAGATPKVSQTGIIKTNINLRGAPITVGSVAITVPGPGQILVRFDGVCISDSGDRVVLAASHTHNWDVDNNNLSFMSGTTSNRRSFSHSRIYTVTAGVDSFFAVAQNYVDYGGGGTASLYGSLTAEYFPDGGDIVVMDDSAVQYGGNIRGSVVVFDSLTLNAPTAGKVLSHFDGVINGSPGDRIVLATSNTANWGSNDGNVSVKAISTTNNKLPFSHTRVYTATIGNNKVYSVGQNYVDYGGTGTASIYANLSALYVPAASAAQMDMHGLNIGSVNLRGGTVALDSITITAPTAGQVLVQFDGNSYSDVGDRIILAASDTRAWGSNDGSVGTSASAPNVGASFSHSRLYPVSAGTHTYYAVAENFVQIAGSGVAGIYGSLTVKYYPDASTGINDVADIASFEMYPNPSMDKIIVQSTDEKAVIEIADINGRIIRKVNATSTETVINIAALDTGIYLVHVGGKTKKLVKQ